MKLYFVRLSRIKIVGSFFLVLASLLVSTMIYSSSDARYHNKKEKSQIDLFQVVRITGQAEVWNIGTPYWRKVSFGQFLYSDSLLRVYEKSSVQLQFHSTRNPNVLKINFPTTVRINQNILRHVDENDVYLPKVPDVWSKSDGGSIKLSLEEAWLRTKMKIGDFVSLKNKDRPESILGNKFEVKRSVKGRPEILSPLNNQIFYPDDIPAVIRMSWDKTDVNLLHDVFIWSVGERPKHPIASVTGDVYHLSVRRWGGHFAQIIPRGGAQSEVVSFFVQRGKITEPDQFDNLTFNDFIEIDSPPSFTSFILKRGDTHIQRFKWRFKGNFSQKYTVKIKIKDLSNDDITSIQVSNQFNKFMTTLYSFSSGTYSWQLELFINDPGGKNASLKSKERIIEIGPKNRLSFGEFFSRAIEGVPRQTRPHQLIFFE